LEEQLRKAGIEVEWSTELAAFDAGPDRVRATLRSRDREASVESAWLCGCDGAHSAAREGAGISFAGGTYPQTFYVADVEASGAATDGDLNFCLGTDVFCVIFPIRTTGSFRLIGFLPPGLRGRTSVTLEDVRPIVEPLAGIRIARERWFSSYQ